MVEGAESSPGLLRAVSVWAVCWLLSAAHGSGEQVTHPVFNPTLSEADARKIAQAYAPLLALKEDELLALVPDRAGFRYCGCPNCDRGTGETQLEWTIYAPHHVRCKFCGMVFPNERFPERYQVVVATPDGRMQVYPYFKDAKGREYFFQARAWFERRRYLAGAAYDMATYYHVKRDTVYARRVALILAQFARLYPGYAVRYEEPFQAKRFFPPNAQPPFPVPAYRAAKWSYWAFLDIPNNLLLAYDLVCPSGVLETLDHRFGRLIREMIEKDFFRSSVEFVLAYPELQHRMSPHIYQGLILAGRVLGERKWVEEGLNRMKRFVQGKFYADGFWCEGAPTYQREVVDLLSLVQKATHGLKPPLKLPLLDKAADVAERFVLPDGHLVPLNETWARMQTLPLAQSRPALYPWLGYAILGHGEGKDQFQMHLNWSAGYGGQHLDKLGVLLFAHGREMLCDIGHTRTRLSTWAASTASHNTVMINGQDQVSGSEAQPNGGDLLLFDARNEFVQIVEAQAPRAYPGVAAEYRRTLISVRVPPRDAYVVDVFHVAGGSQHDWFLHGNADEDSDADCSLPLEARQEEGFLNVKNLRRAITDQTWSVNFRSTKAEGVGLCSTVLGAPNTEVYIGQAPSIRRAREDESLLDKYHMPIIVARRRGASGHLASIFTAIHAPYMGQPFISKVAPIDLGVGAVGLVITHTAGKDYVIVDGKNSRARSVSVAEGELRFRGRIGVARVAEGKGWLYMVDSEEMALGQHHLTSAGRSQGVISAVYAASEKVPAFFETPAFLGDAPHLQGAIVIVRHGDGSTHGFALKEVIQPDRERSWIFLTDDPGFTYDPARRVTQFTHFPGRTIAGSNSFFIPHAAFTTWKK